LAQERQWQERPRCTCFHPYERDGCQNRSCKHSEERCRPSPMRSFDRGEGKTTEGNNGEDLTRQIELAAFRLDAFLDRIQREKQSSRAGRQTHVKNASPADAVDEPASDRWPDDEGKAIAACPDTHRMGTFFPA